MKNKSRLRYRFNLKVIMAVCLLQSLHFTVSGIDNPIVFPIPQNQQITSESFVLDESVSIMIPENASENDYFLARFLVRELSDKYGLALKIVSGTDIPQAKKVIVMGTVSNPLIKGYIEKNNLELNAENPGSEGYILNVSDDKIIVAGWDDPGAFYGLQSLRQLIRSGKGKKVQGVAIRDWPNLPVRAIRLYVPGTENLAFFRRFLRDFMSLYKFNHVIVELNCMRLDKHPEVNAGWIEFAKDLQYSRLNRPVGKRGEGKTSSHFDAGDGQIIEKQDVRDIVNFANENFIEVDS